MYNHAYGWSTYPNRQTCLLSWRTKINEKKWTIRRVEWQDFAMKRKTWSRLHQLAILDRKSSPHHPPDNLQKKIHNILIQMWRDGWRLTVGSMYTPAVYMNKYPHCQVLILGCGSRPSFDKNENKPCYSDPQLREPILVRGVRYICSQERMPSTTST